MAYNEKLASRVGEILGQQPGLIARKMFGGVGYMLNGNMACGILNDDLIVRVGAESYQEALAQPHTKVFDTRGGRPMTGWVMVEPAGTASDGDLETWVRRGAKFAATLPPK